VTREKGFSKKRSDVLQKLILRILLFYIDNEEIIESFNSDSDDDLDEDLVFEMCIIISFQSLGKK
jgi:hypothetical protein